MNRRTNIRNNKTFIGKFDEENLSSMIAKFNDIFSESTIQRMPGENLLASINEFLISYRHFPITEHLNKIIAVTSGFLSDTDPTFSSMRNVSDKTILARMDKQATLLKKLFTSLEGHDSHTVGIDFVKRVKQIALGCINDRITELKDSKDKIYYLYSTQGNPLRDLLERHSNLTYR